MSDDAGAAGPVIDETAFAALVREHADAVFGVAFRRIGDRALAEDLSQETFLRAWRHRRAFRGDTSVRGWLCVIAVNVVRDHLRSRMRRPRETEAVHLDVPDLGDDPAEVAVARDALRRLRDALPLLPANQREMFLLRERDGLTYKEIAAVLGCPVGTVMSGLARARERLVEAVRA